MERVLRVAIPVLAGSVALASCALPVPVQVASWVIEGLSLMTTEKTIADHGISLVADKDCSLWRGMSEGSVCRDDDATTEVVVAAEGSVEEPAVEVADAFVAAVTGEPGDLVPRPARKTAEAETAAESDAATAAVDVARLGAFETAAGPAEPDAETALEGLASRAPVFIADEAKPEESPVDQMWRDIEAGPSAAAAAPTAVTPTVMAAAAIEPVKQPGIYYVVGSFRVWSNAERLAGVHAGLGTHVLASDVGGRSLYRVVVGPFEWTGRSAVRRAVRRAGIEDIWAIRIDPDRWMLARAPVVPADGSGDVARLPNEF